ncbi:hypothetical protein ABVF61_06300 [Roseibium sp. HPY-6]|uniref:hypothetical protein n=1 Tax=Roseibium sp. HPY-6 TaxID=3229852 RepID=UPI00338F5C45
MFRILLIVGLLIAGVQQGFARGTVDVSETETQVIMSMDQAVSQLSEDACCDEQPVAETKPSFCKNSECKAVMASVLSVSLKEQDHPDWVTHRSQASAQKRLEPKPPNS